MKVWLVEWCPPPPLHKDTSIAKFLKPIQDILFGNRIFCGWLRILRWAHPGLSSWAWSLITTVYIKDRQRKIWGRHTEEKKGMWCLQVSCRLHEQRARHRDNDGPHSEARLSLYVSWHTFEPLSPHWSLIFVPKFWEKINFPKIYTINEVDTRVLWRFTEKISRDELF